MLRRSLLAAALFSPAVQAQVAYPSRSARLLVGSGAGGASDIVARILAEAMDATFPRGLVIDNRPGAGATIAASTVARAAPDGYTLLLSSASMLAINPVLMRQIPFDAANDFTHITMLSEFPFVIVVHPSVPATTLLELGAWARAQPEPLIYGSPNPGSEHHLGMEQLAERLGFRTQHIGFRGGGPATTALLGRQILVGSVGLPPLVPQLREGRLRALAVSTSARSPLVPEVPTIAEAGIEGLSLAVWQGLAGPRGMPAEIVQFLAAAFAEALAKPDVIRKLAAQGLRPRPMPPAEFDAFMAAQRESWGRAARAANIVIE
ncbi:tripartite tricarboxylate transporter substrate binding protein [Roseomonas sp. AR75]|uniref:Bug family tripartite tricarboxylate transporter substrate binding protein n=1 Tax=Roseomonas sp. AR75 TaxID=2562311 RepID=UPI0010C11481|nr:tripartite tricarboxylate transporter substrate binding protein [Roseomonas sp. AR75]